MDTEAAPDNYCAAPFRHMVLESNGRMSPCCLWNHGNIPDHAKPSALAKDPFNQAWMQQVRSDMLANTEIAGCSECNMREASGVKSMRSAFNLDYVIGVSAPQHLRIHRAMERDNISREEVLARMNKQIEENIKMRLCDFVIVNDEQQLVTPQVLQLHERFLQEAKNNT